MATLPEMPFEVLQHTMEFLSTLEDLNSCETTCKAFNNVVRDDQTWRHCISSHPHFPGASYRQSACIMNFLQKIKQHQGDTTNYFLQVLSPDRWKDLVELSMSAFLNDSITDVHAYKLRGDTMGVLAELVQANLIHQLKCANKICCKDKSAAFPTLRVQHLILQGDDSRGLGRTEADEVDAFINEIYEEFFFEKELDQIVRRSAFAAGVVLMETDVYFHVLVESTKLIAKLMEPACIQLIGTIDEAFDSDDEVDPLTCHERQPRPLCSGDTIDAIAPSSVCNKWLFRAGRMTTSDTPRDPDYEHTPVPKQIEDAASQLSLATTKVYGDVWLVFDRETKEEALAAAYTDYTSDEDSFSSNDEPFEESDDDFSLATDTSSDDDMSLETFNDFHERLERYGPIWCAGVAMMYGTELQPFIRAAKFDNLNLVKYLVEVEGIDVNLRDGESGWAALDYARGNDNDEMVKYLTSHGATDQEMSDSEMSESDMY